MTNKKLSEYLGICCHEHPDGQLDSKDEETPLSECCAVEKMTDEKLEKASRQYRHNNSDGFVHAYDKEEIDAYVNTLNAKIAELEELICVASPIRWAMIGDDAGAGAWEKEAEFLLSKGGK